jgi:lipopolysaccharide transport system permease protein
MDRTAAAAPNIVTIVDPSLRRPILNLREIWAFRELVFFLVWRDMKVRYRQTYLGILWAILQPTIAVSVFSIFFGKLVGVPSNGMPYPLFVLCGLVPWNFFSRAVGSMTGSLIGSQELVKRVYFPRIAIPMSAMLSCVMDMVPGFAIVLVALAVFATAPAVQVVLLPVFVLVMMAAVLGLGLALSAWNVRFRDIGYIVPFALQILLFMTPIVYPGSLVPDAWRPLYSLNPMVGIVEAIRWCVVGAPVDWGMVAISTVSSVLLLACGLVAFSRAERVLPDLI